MRRFRLFRVRSSLLTESLIYFIFLEVLRYFTSLGWLIPAYVFSRMFPGMTLEGLPHSDIAGLKVVSTYPTLFAGYHVLHRLLVPRHPPYALCNLTKNLPSIHTQTSPAFDGFLLRCIAFLESTLHWNRSSLLSTRLFVQRHMHQRRIGIDND